MDIRSTRAMCASVAACFGVFTTHALAADDYEPRGAITLAQALDAALTVNPELAAGRYELSAAQARIVRAGTRPNPELSLELENFAGEAAARQADALESTLSISQVVELGGKRDLRRALAEADRDVTALELRARQLDLLADVARRFIDVVASQERLRYAEASLVLAQKTLDAIAARVKAARSPVAEASRARIAVTRAQIERQQARLRLETARGALALTWGQPIPKFTSAKAELFDFPQLAPFAQLALKIEKTPDILRFASEMRMRDAELSLARAQRRPNVAFSVGLRNFQATGDNAVVAGFSLPLAIHDRNQGNIAEVRSRRAQLDAQREAGKTRILGALYALYREAEAARERASALREHALPQARDALTQTEYGYQRGRFSYLELLTAQQELLELNAAAVDAAADHHRLIAEIERLTSEPLTTANLEAPLP